MLASQPVRTSDVHLDCRLCGSSFVYSAGEQELHTLRGVSQQPSVCPPCRKLAGRR